MSSFLTNLAKAGDSLSLAGPLGSFYLRPIQRPLLLLAGVPGWHPSPRCWRRSPSRAVSTRCT